jgi:hypothetical protein
LGEHEAVEGHTNQTPNQQDQIEVPLILIIPLHISNTRHIDGKTSRTDDESIDHEDDELDAFSPLAPPECLCVSLAAELVLESAHFKDEEIQYAPDHERGNQVYHV